MPKQDRISAALAAYMSLQSMGADLRIVGTETGHEHGPEFVSVTVYRAMYGCPADVVTVAGESRTVESFSVGHVYTDNQAAFEYARTVARSLGCSVRLAAGI